jgi:hypothetical protein
VEWLKVKALSSSPSTTKKKKKRILDQILAMLASGKALNYNEDLPSSSLKFTNVWISVLWYSSTDFVFLYEKHS